MEATASFPAWLAIALVFLSIPASSFAQVIERSRVIREVLTEALQAAGAVEPEGLRSNLLAQIAPAQARAGDITGARQTAASIQDFRSKSSALVEIVFAQAEAGDLAGARETAAAIPTEPWRSFAFGRISSAENPQQAAAMRTFHEAHLQVVPQNGGAAGNQNPRTVALEQAKAGEMAAALDTTSKIDDPNQREAVLADIAALEAEKGSFSHALQIADGIQQSPRKADALRRIAAALARAGNAVEVRRWTEELQPAHSRASALLGLAQGLLAAQQAASARTATPPQ